MNDKEIFSFIYQTAINSQKIVNILVGDIEYRENVFDEYCKSKYGQLLDYFCNNDQKVRSANINPKNFIYLMSYSASIWSNVVTR